MDLIEKFGPVAAEKSINQYCPPKCFELAGREFRFVLDTGEEAGEYLLKIADGVELEWSFRGSPMKREAYECRKSDDWTYLLTFVIDGTEHRENHTFVIDLEQELVTFLLCKAGENPYYPYIIESRFGFGYIAIEGKEHTGIRRHGFTNNVTGTSVRWVYGHNMSTVHIYHDPHWYRITYPRSAVDTQEVPDSTKELRELMQEMPSSDEQAYYVKIKEAMYPVSVTEQNLEKILAERFGFRSDTLCFLDNWDRMYSVGRAFGKKTVDGEDRNLFIMIGKYGMPEEVDPGFFTNPNPYLV
ncbi:MAG: hypothetical protein IKE61_00145 [Coriobacteriales bacterium]|nr:hypothetical protein [Coriobacteriales bacterium]